MFVPAVCRFLRVVLLVSSVGILRQVAWLFLIKQLIQQVFILIKKWGILVRPVLFCDLRLLTPHEFTTNLVESGLCFK